MKTPCDMSMSCALGWVLLIGATAQAGVIRGSQDVPPAATLATEARCIGAGWLGRTPPGGGILGPDVPIADTWKPRETSPITPMSCFYRAVASAGPAEDAAVWLPSARCAGGALPGGPVAGISPEELAQHAALLPPAGPAEVRAEYADIAILYGWTSLDAGGLGRAEVSSPECLPATGDSAGWSGGTAPAACRAGLTFFRPGGEGYTDRASAARAGASGYGGCTRGADARPGIPRSASAMLFGVILVTLPWCVGRRTMVLRRSATG